MSDYLDRLERELLAAGRRARATESASHRRGALHWPWSGAGFAPTGAAVAVAAAVLVFALLVLHPGKRAVHPASRPIPVSPIAPRAAQRLPLGAPDTAKRPGPFGRVISGSGAIVAQAADLYPGQLPWGMRAVRTTDGQTCPQVGRLQDGQLGVVGEDGLYGNDGRFHPLALAALGLNCVQTDGDGHGFDNVVSSYTIAAGWTWAGTPCTPPAYAQHRRHVCPQGDMRDVEYGLLGPDAVSITYRIGSQSHVKPVGPDGAYLIVGPPDAHGCTPRSCGGSGIGFSASANVPRGRIIAITYRNGRVCRPAGHLATGGGGCPPVGYVAPEARHVTDAQVQTPITVRELPAPRYCTPTRSGEPVPCAGKIPRGYSVYPEHHQLLVQASWTARVAADGHNSLYEYVVQDPPGCGSGTGSSQLSGIAAYGHSVRASERLEERFFAPCPGTYTVNVGFVPNVGPGGTDQTSSTPMEIPGSLPVGRATFTVK